MKLARLRSSVSDSLISALTPVCGLQHNYSKYVEPYVNKIPRASTSTSSQAPNMPSNARSTTSTSTSSHTAPVMPSGMHAVADPVPLSEPKKVI